MVPLPRSHRQLEGFPVDWSWNCTTRGEHPATLVAVKPAFTWAFKRPAVQNTPARINSTVKWFFIGLMISNTKKHYIINPYVGNRLGFGTLIINSYKVKLGVLIIFTYQYVCVVWEGSNRSCNIAIALQINNA